MIVLLVVYLFMPMATRAFADWLRSHNRVGDLEAGKNLGSFQLPAVCAAPPTWLLRLCRCLGLVAALYEQTSRQGTMLCSAQLTQRCRAQPLRASTASTSSNIARITVAACASWNRLSDT